MFTCSNCGFQQEHPKGFPPLKRCPKCGFQPFLENDRHWYIDDELNLVLRYHNDQGPRWFNVLNAVSGTAGFGHVTELQGTLWTYRQQLERGQAQAGDVFIPVNLSNLHWVALRLVVNHHTRGVVSVQYFDPMGGHVPYQVLAALQATLGFFIPVTNLDLPLQRDGYNCGPWVAAWLMALCEGKDLPDPGLDLQVLRSLHAGVEGVREARNRYLEESKKKAAAAKPVTPFPSLGSSQPPPSLVFRPFELSRFQLEHLLPHLAECDDSELLALEEFLLPVVLGNKHYKGDQRVIENTVAALGHHSLALGRLYRAFQRNSAAKQLALQSLWEGMKALKQLYKAQKQSVLDWYGIKKDGSGAKSSRWDDKVKRLQAPDREKKHYLRPQLVQHNGGVLRLEASNLGGWFSAMIVLVTLRKIITEVSRSTGKPVRHITSLAFPGFQILVVNEKDQQFGTTRMVWPVGEETDPVRKVKFRCMDLNYAEIYRVVMNLLEQLHVSDRKLAEQLLGVVRGDAATVAQLSKQRLFLSWFRCSFLYGVGAGPEGTPVIHAQDWFMDKSRKSKKLPFPRQVSAYEAACNVLAVLFLAEPRHALAMWRSTLLSLQLIADGFLTFEQLFSSLGGAIGYGRLLPGANVLGKALKEQGVKRLAMPLVDAVTLDLDETAQTDVSLERALADGSDPVYQPLIKALFVELLGLLVASRDVKPAYTLKYPGSEDLLWKRQKELREKYEPPDFRPRPGSMHCWVPPPAQDGAFKGARFVAWDVTRDPNAFYRVLSLALHGDESQHRAYRMQSALYLAGQCLGPLQALLLKARLATHMVAFREDVLSEEARKALWAVTQSLSPEEQACVVMATPGVATLSEHLPFIAEALTLCLVVFMAPERPGAQVRPLVFRPKKDFEKYVCIGVENGHHYLLLDEGRTPPRDLPVPSHDEQVLLSESQLDGDAPETYEQDADEFDDLDAVVGVKTYLDEDDFSESDSASFSDGGDEDFVLEEDDEDDEESNSIYR